MFYDWFSYLDLKFFFKYVLSRGTTVGETGCERIYAFSICLIKIYGESEKFLVELYFFVVNFLWIF